MKFLPCSKLPPPPEQLLIIFPKIFLFKKKHWGNIDFDILHLPLQAHTKKLIKFMFLQEGGWKAVGLNLNPKLTRSFLRTIFHAWISTFHRKDRERQMRKSLQLYFKQFPRKGEGRGWEDDHNFVPGANINSFFPLNYHLFLVTSTTHKGIIGRPGRWLA